MAFLDFQEIKKTHRIEDVAARLNLTFTANGDQLRGRCCDKDRSLALNVARQSFFCHSSQTGGDLISLAAHVLGVGMKEAAQWIADKKAPETPETAPPATNGLARVRDYLEWSHPALRALGLDPDQSEAYGIGHAPKGSKRNCVLIPLYLDGKLADYIGVPVELVPQLKLSNVVKLKAS